VRENGTVAMAKIGKKRKQNPNQGMENHDSQLCQTRNKLIKMSHVSD
jgi:hypothetical protein